MERIRLGRTGVEVSAISLGTWAHGGPNTNGDWSVGWSGHDEAAAGAALRRAHEVGIRHWDCADVYGSGRAEELIGTVWGDVPRDDIFLASKFGWDKGPHDHFYDPEYVAAQLEGSLRRMRTDRIDLFYLHHCDFGPDDGALDGALDVLVRAREAGKIRFIGLSDWDDTKIARLAPRVQPDVVQGYRNLCHDTYASSGLQAWVEEHDAGAVFFSPLRHGLLLGKYIAPPGFGRGDFRENVEAFEDAALLDRLRALREEVTARLGDGTGAMVRALAMSLLADAAGTCALVGMRTPAQVDDAAAACRRLDRDDADWLRAAYAAIGEV